MWITLLSLFGWDVMILLYDLFSYFYTSFDNRSVFHRFISNSLSFSHTIFSSFSFLIISLGSYISWQSWYTSSIFDFVVASCFSLLLEEQNVSSNDSVKDNCIPSYTHYSNSQPMKAYARFIIIVFLLLFCLFLHVHHLRYHCAKNIYFNAQFLQHSSLNQVIWVLSLHY